MVWTEKKCGTEMYMGPKKAGTEMGMGPKKAGTEKIWDRNVRTEMSPAESYRTEIRISPGDMLLDVFQDCPSSLFLTT